MSKLDIPRTMVMSRAGLACVSSSTIHGNPAPDTGYVVHFTVCVLLISGSICICYTLLRPGMQLSFLLYAMAYRYSQFDGPRNSTGNIWKSQCTECTRGHGHTRLNFQGPECSILEE